jgi:hypothetical protein
VYQQLFSPVRVAKPGNIFVGLAPEHWLEKHPAQKSEADRLEPENCP